MEKKDLFILSMIVLFAALLLIAPYALRYMRGNTTLLNEESYKHMRLINTVDPGFVDPLYEHPISINIIYLLPPAQPLLYLFINMALGLASIILFYFILTKHNITHKNSWAMLVLLVTSPIFIHVFQGINQYGLIIFLSLAAILLLIENQWFVSMLLFAIIPFIDFYWACVSLIVLVIYLVYNNKSTKGSRYVIIFFVLAILASYFSNTLLGNSLFTHLKLIPDNIITDIGADLGFSFSMIILALVGFVLLWEKGLKNVLLYAGILIWIVLAVFNELLRVYLNFVLVVYAGFAIIYLYRRKWSIQLIKKTTMLLIVCSILFSTLFYVTNATRAEPSPELTDALVFLKTQALQNETVLGPATLSYEIEYFASTKTFINPDTASLDTSQEILLGNLTKSRNLDYTEKLLNENHIRYIFIDSEFQKYLEEQDGLLFIMQTSGKFSQIYKNPKFEIWMYTR